MLIIYFRLFVVLKIKLKENSFKILEKWFPFQPEVNIIHILYSYEILCFKILLEYNFFLPFKKFWSARSL